MLKKLLLCAAVAMSALSLPAYAMNEAGAKAILEVKMKKWINDRAVTDAIKAQNVANADLTEEEILALDEKWRAGDEELINKVLNNDLSEYLRYIVEHGNGFYTEIFVMDNKGLNVGQNIKTSDFWQGDEDKWQKTYLVGPDAIHVTQAEIDESSQTYQVQLSTTVSDGDTPIGAITIGINAHVE